MIVFGLCLQQQRLIPQVKTEKRDGSSTNDPYVAFRRRTEKMQTRKVRIVVLGMLTDGCQILAHVIFQKLACQNSTVTLDNFCDKF